MHNLRALNWCICWVFILHDWNFQCTTIGKVSGKGLFIFPRRHSPWSIRRLLRGGQSSDQSDSANSESDVATQLPHDFPTKFASEENLNAAKQAYNAGDAEALRAALDKVRIDLRSKLEIQGI